MCNLKHITHELSKLSIFLIYKIGFVANEAFENNDF